MEKAILKKKLALEIFETIQSDEEVCKIQGEIACDSANEILSSWEGKLKIYKDTFKVKNNNELNKKIDEEEFYLSLQNLVLRGSILKNTLYIIGISGLYWKKYQSYDEL